MLRRWVTLPSGNSLLLEMGLEDGLARVSALRPVESPILHLKPVCPGLFSNIPCYIGEQRTVQSTSGEDHGPH
jgi:hypothetical protein